MPTPKVSVLTYFFLPKMEMKEFGLREGDASLAPPWILQCKELVNDTVYEIFLDLDHLKLSVSGPVGEPTFKT